MAGLVAPTVEPAASTGQALPRRALTLACLAHAALFTVIALELPWRAGSITWVTAGLAVAHTATGLLSLVGPARLMILSWRVLAGASLVVFVLGLCLLGGSAAYLIRLYGSIGNALAAALIGFIALLGLITLPIACWAFSATGWFAQLKRAVRGSRSGVVALLLAALPVAVVTWAYRQAQAEPVQNLDVPRFEARLRGAPPLATAHKPPTPSLFHASPAVCPRAPSTRELTLLVTAIGLDPAAPDSPTTRCVQTSDLGVAAGRVLEATQGSKRVQVDLVTALHPLRQSYELLDALKLRPALDGVCAGTRCLTPWQLVALDAFTTYQPLPSVKDAQFGCSFEQLSKALGADAPLVRVVTNSYTWDGTRFERLGWLRTQRELDRESLKRSVLDAERHITAAQRADGTFRYTLDPYSGEEGSAPPTLPRQAGTTLVLCELGRGNRVRRAVSRALDQMSRYEKQWSDLSILAPQGDSARLGQLALPLIAFLSCGAIVGDKHDALVQRLGRALLRMQRTDGGFYTELDATTGSTSGTREALYAGGQAVFALVLLEQHARARGANSDARRFGAAAERAMDHYSQAYWPAFLRQLFFLEENWHCLAARAALTSRRHDGYERFCLEYVGFKSRLILTTEDAPPELIGGYSLSAMLPPHATPSAGFGEAMAAALAVKRARKEDASKEKALLKDVLGFVHRQQWTAGSCFACASNGAAVGAFSESAASPVIRIDYVQHAMAALGHGGRELGLL